MLMFLLFILLLSIPFVGYLVGRKIYLILKEKGNKWALLISVTGTLIVLSLILTACFFILIYNVMLSR